MTAELLSQIVSQSMRDPDWDNLKSSSSDYWKRVVKAAVSVIPKVGGAVAEGVQLYYDFKDDEFFRKFTRYLLGIEGTTSKERSVFAEEIEKKADDYSGNVILGMVDRLDNINKQTIFAKLTSARINGYISIEDFFRLHSLLDRIPYVDLKGLSQYVEPTYDESGDTELLFATGALEIDTIDAKGGPNKYVLSRLGEMLLRWGFDIQLDLKHGCGTNVELDALTRQEIEELTNLNKNYNPQIDGETLVL